MVGSAAGARAEIEGFLVRLDEAAGRAGARPGKLRLFLVGGTAMRWKEYRLTSADEDFLVLSADERDRLAGALRSMGFVPELEAAARAQGIPRIDPTRLPPGSELAAPEGGTGIERFVHRAFGIVDVIHGRLFSLRLVPAIARHYALALELCTLTAYVPSNEALFVLKLAALRERGERKDAEDLEDLASRGLDMALVGSIAAELGVRPPGPGEPGGGLRRTATPRRPPS